MNPENTARRDPLLHLAGAMAEGSDGYITGMEAAGQRQLVASASLPTDTHGTDEKFTALGFVFGEPDPADPLFRPTTLPAGWSKEGRDYAMGSYVLDERGLRRVGVFYKAAWYDRRANMHLIDVGTDTAQSAIYGDGDVSVPWNKLTEGERADVLVIARNYLASARQHPDIYGDRAGRAQQLLNLYGGEQQ